MRPCYLIFLPNFHISYLNNSFYLKMKRRYVKCGRYCRLMLMILYNVSMNKTGLQYLFESRVGDALSYCLDDEVSSEEIQLLCLRVLQSVTYDLEEPKYIHDLTTIIPIEKIEMMTSVQRKDISDAAKQVVKYLRRGQKLTKWLLKTELSVPYECVISSMIRIKVCINNKINML